MRPGRSLRRRCGRRDAGSCQDVSAAAEDAGGEDAGAEAAAAFEGGFCAGVEGLVHPVAGTAFADAAEADALEVEFLTDEGIEVEGSGGEIESCAEAGGECGIARGDGVIEGEGTGGGDGAVRACGAGEDGGG